jgi:predicted transcriptional regulator
MSDTDKNTSLRTERVELQVYQDTSVRKGLEEMRQGKVVRHDEIVERMQMSGRVSE